MRVALVQTDCLLGDVDENLRRVKDVVTRARTEGTGPTGFALFTGVWNEMS